MSTSSVLLWNQMAGGSNQRKFRSTVRCAHPRSLPQLQRWKDFQARVVNAAKGQVLPQAQAHQILIKDGLSHLCGIPISFIDMCSLLDCC